MNVQTLSPGQASATTNQQPATTAPEMITVPKEQLQTLITQKRELMTVLSAAVDIIGLIQELFGGSMPTTAADIITRVPRIMKAVKGNGDFMSRFADKLETLKAIAPNYLSPEMLAKVKIPLPAHE